MPPDPTGGAAPRATGPGEPTTAIFRGGVERVDETTASSRTRAVAGDAAAPRDDGRARRVRARKVHRIVRHVDPWSVLKISLLFFLALFLIICVASAVLWNGARSSGAITNVEDFITEVGGFGNCPQPTTPPVSTSTSVPDAAVIGATTSTTLAPTSGDSQGCPGGAELEGTFKFEDGKIFEAFGLGGVVLVLAGSAGAVVMALLFNLMSDLTGGVRVTVLEEDSAPGPSRTGSPGRRRRD